MLDPAPKMEDGVMPGISINWEVRGWRAALQKGTWGCWLAAGSTGASPVPWQPGGQTAPWGAPDTAQPAGQKGGSSCCVQHWCGLTVSPVCSAGPHNLRSCEGP